MLAYAGFFELNRFLWKRYKIKREERDKKLIQEIRKSS
jgi:hypothetical protein